MKIVLMSIGLFLLAAFVQAATSAQYYAAGIQLYRQAQYAKSIQYLNAAVKLDPQNWRAYQVMGQAYYQLGDKADAVQAMDQSLRVNPNNPGLRQFRDKLAGNTSSSTAFQKPQGLGLGLEIGDPGSWGVSGKFWLDGQSALQPTLKIGVGTTVQMDYLLHDFSIIHPSSGLMPVYFGAGGGVGLGGGVAVEARGVVGLSYLFNKTSLPLDIYVQLVPNIWFGGGGSSGLLFDGNVGSRFYF